MHIDTSIEIIVDVTHAAARGESVLPLGIAQQIACMAGGRTINRLSPVETEIAGALADGLSIYEISRKLAMSDRTVRRRLQTLYVKLGVTSKAAAIERLQTGR